jgi:hypothetical protein
MLRSSKWSLEAQIAECKKNLIDNVMFAKKKINFKWLNPNTRGMICGN